MDSPTIRITAENTILTVAIVNDNIQIFTNKAMINRLHPRDAKRCAELLRTIIAQDFKQVITV